MYTICIIIYNIIIYCVQPFIWIKLLWMSKHVPAYRKNWLERYGFYIFKNLRPGGIVLHAVSLGETLSIAPLIKALQKYYPNTIITLTSMTPSGLEMAQQFTPNNNIQCIYLPYDLPCSIQRFIKQIRPKLVIVMETELWPNLIRILYKHNIPLIIANARLSVHSFIKYKKINKFLFHIIKHITIIAAQYKSDAYKFLQLGLKQNQICIIGNLKFNITITQNLLKQIEFLKKTWVKQRPTWIASSTHPGEELLLLTVHKQLLSIFPNLLMILAPRHIERCLEISRITKKLGLSYIMKSNNIIPTTKTQVIINDTFGELMLLYGIANIAFVGGSLVRHGGHNPLEPAAHAIPIIMGPYTFNFNDICTKLHTSGGLITIFNSKSLIHILSTLLKNPGLRIYHGNCAAQVFKNNQGALKKLLDLIYKYLPPIHK